MGGRFPDPSFAYTPYTHPASSRNGLPASAERPLLHGIEGNLFFIDTICLLSNENYLDTYKSLSPNWKH